MPERMPTHTAGRLPSPAGSVPSGGSGVLLMRDRPFGGRRERAAPRLVGDAGQEQRDGDEQEQLWPGESEPRDLVAADELDAEPEHPVRGDVQGEGLARRD